MGERGFFEAFEAIAREHQGRPHWGKLHTLADVELASVFPRFADFCAARDRLDPLRRFGNPQVERLLGP